MKKIHILLILLQYFCYNAINAQVTANVSLSVTSCTSNSIDVDLSFNGYPEKVYPDIKSLYVSTKGCARVLVNPTQTPLYETYSLQKQNPNLSWTTVRTVGPTFFGTVQRYVGLSHGSYRLTVDVPNPIKTSNCEGNYLIVTNYSGQIYGKVGTYGFATTSNTVIIGATDQNDIAFNWIKTQGTPPPPNLSNPPIYCFEENPKISTVGTHNYTHYWVAIFEQGLGTTNRYASTGWISGQIPAEIDLLTDVWKVGGGTSWEFTPIGPSANPSYQVQFAITNGCNTSWTTIANPMPFFQKRPQGWGCRNTEEDQAIVISPNPAMSYFSIPAIETGDSNIKVSVSDMTGRIVKQYNSVQQQYEVSDLSNGIYVVNVTQQGVRIHSSKLSVIN